MARKRLISPEFFQHADLYEAERESGLPVRLAFAGLWTVADRRGIFQWSRNLKPQILPYDSCDFLEVLAALERHGFVRRYEVEGRAFGIIPTFASHQTFHHAERENKNFPAPPEGLLVSPRPSLGPALGDTEPGPAVAVAVSASGTAAVAASTTTPLLPAPRKPRASRATSGEDEKTSWITPFENLWKKLGGPTSWDRGPALREFAAIRKHYAEDEILRRLAWYFENKGSEAVLPPEQMERRNFVPHPRDFRIRFERFDPSAAADEREVQEAWARAVHDGWVAGVGQISPFRIRNELRRFVELYPDEKTAETALRTALRNYLDTCRRRVESPRWPEFASNIVGHLPPHLKLRPAAAA